MAEAGSEIELESFLSPHLVCPISHCLMEQPVTAPSGHSYELTSILAWLERRSIDPLSQECLDPASLYPNRALQAEIVHQLEALRDRTRGSNAALADIAQQRLTAINALGARPEAATGFAGTEHGSIENCAVATVWCATLAWRQALFFGTSFGFLLAVGVSAASWLWRSLSAPHSLPGTQSRTGRAQVVGTFLQLALSPTAPTPSHWLWLERSSLILLRTSLLLPAIAFASALAAGCCLSSCSFLQICRLRWAAEHERALQSPWFGGILHGCAGVLGFASVGLLTRVCWDAA
mmetsp:Transcript_43601/g.79437  ORF Transcript_43601/g.79437 Transcript_43601/m.79437 type:complete len:292 (-) Transcript_43601:20-895(-)